MSRRARALSLIALAGVCAVAAASIAGSYGASVDEQLGELRPVVVAAADLRAGRRIGAREADRRLEVRRVPERFAPADALSSPADAVGRAPAAGIPAGSYVGSAQLRSPRRRPRREPIGDGRRPVEIAVSGGAAVAAAGDPGASDRVDVVVTTEPRVGGRGRTYVAARRVRLLALDQGGAGRGADDELPGPPLWTATLALRREQAIRLIQAESYARQVRLLPRPDG